MGRFVFGKDLETGIHGVDEQHRELFAWGNAVLDYPETLAVADDFVRLYRFLASYARFHFASEEAAMRKHEYDLLESHIKQHEKFRDELSQLYDRASISGPTKEVRLRTQFVLGDWLIYHIKEADIRLASHIRTKMLEEEDTLPSVLDMKQAGFDIEGLSDQRVPRKRPEDD